ncbi:MAG TPA: PilZ domain-containing protein, partial [Syntrophorhabdaceae bacterium]|nr:PilZ domain-containing protein [Syntrophorhabdaceae bacterium]
MIHEDERRSYFRIHDHLVLEFRQITPEEFLVLKDTISRSTTRIPDEPQESHFILHKGLKPEDEELYGYMRIINQKLDTILDLLSNSGKGSFQNLKTEVSLGGSGIQFLSGIPLHENDYTELKMSLPVFPYCRITVLCQVVWTEPVADNQETAQLFKMGMKFLVINERDQDALVKYIFEKERE